MNRDGELRRALTLSYAAVAWSLVAGTASIIIGVAAASTALVGTGADVLADLLSSVVLIWRFRSERLGRRASHIVERRAQIAAATALLIVAVAIAATATVRLVQRQGPSPSAAGLVVASLSVVVLPVFARLKYLIAARIASPALRLDGHITMVGAAMATITLAGLAVTRAFGVILADPIAALVIAVIAGATATVALVAERRSAP